ncbi:MAG: hypothetical protein AAGJ54_03780 [Planctomycetota bacterium]
MRNIFDQYTQPENRLTHALVCTLEADRTLLRPFLAWTAADGIPKPSQLHITEQQVPGEMTAGDEGEAKGLPDACVFDDEGWAFLVEAKVQAPVSPDQLRRHVRTAKRYGFESPFLLLLSVDPPPRSMPPRSSYRAWRDVYAWFRRRAGSSLWADTFTRYMEAFESRMIGEDYSIRGTLTMFDGFHFNDENPYTYREGKRLIRLLGDEVQARKDLRALGVDPKGARRSAITGRGGDGVWDFLPLKAARDAKNFTDFPHLTLGVHRQNAGASITIPNGVRGGFKSSLKELGEDGFLTLLEKIERKTRAVRRGAPGSKTTIYATQRHYRSQRSNAEVDANIEADIRTVVRDDSATKYQPEWARAVYGVLTQKRSNIQLGITTKFPYDAGPIRSVKAADFFARAWIAMSPILDVVLGEDW